MPTLPLYWNHKGGRGRSLGTNISRLRAEKRLSQGDLAEVLEVSRQSVSKWETGRGMPGIDTLEPLDSGEGAAVPVP